MYAATRGPYVKWGRTDFIWGGPGTTVLPAGDGRTCECRSEEQIVGHVVLQCPIHQQPHGLHGLTVLDDETIEWQINICPEI